MKVNSNSLRSRVTALRHRFLENWINDDKIQCYTPQEIQTCTFSGTKSRSVTHRVEKRFDKDQHVQLYSETRKETVLYMPDNATVKCASRFEKFQMKVVTP